MWQKSTEMVLKCLPDSWLFEKLYTKFSQLELLNLTTCRFRVSLDQKYMAGH
jgi:hypothetical protein